MSDELAQKRRAQWRAVVETYECETCGATPGQPCVTYSGTVKREPHAPRSQLAADHHWRTADVIADEP